MNAIKGLAIFGIFWLLLIGSFMSIRFLMPTSLVAGWLVVAVISIVLFLVLRREKRGLLVFGMLWLVLISSLLSVYYIATGPLAVGWSIIAVVIIILLSLLRREKRNLHTDE